MANEILVPALMDGDKVIVPQVWLGRGIGYKTANGDPLTAADYQKFNPPTLAELRHAFFDKKPDGSFVSPEYRQSVRSKRGYGEWISTFLRDNKEAIERPEQIRYNQKFGSWLAEGGKVSRVELPPDGWTVEYDRPTGLPSKTSIDRKDAEKVFGEDTSYFHSNKSGLRIAVRDFGINGPGPFNINCMSLRHLEGKASRAHQHILGFRRSFAL